MNVDRSFKNDEMFRWGTQKRNLVALHIAVGHTTHPHVKITYRDRYTRDVHLHFG